MAYTTGDDNYGVTSYIVDPTAGNGNYTTIASALTAASAASFAGDIFIRPGTYTENLTLVAGVNLVAWPGDGMAGTVIIKGNCTLSTAGTVSISGCQLQTNSAACVTVSGSVASILNLIGCYINCTNNSGITFSSSSSSSKLNMEYCTGDTGTTGIALISNSASGPMNIYFCNFTNSGSTLTACTLSGSASTTIFNTYFNQNFTTSNTAGITAAYSNFGAGISGVAFTYGSSGGNFGAFACRFYGGVSSAISVSAGSMFSISQCEINSMATNAITGAGLIIYQGLAFTGASTTINTTTQTGSGTLVGSRNTAPSPGFIGEQIRSNVISSSAVPTPSGSPTTITSISLTAGVWDISSVCSIGAILVSTTFVSAISTTTNSLGASVSGDSQIAVNLLANAAGINATLTIPAFRVTLSTTTTYYLISNPTYASTGGASWGRISATRVG